jgi:hypothetical protein
LANVAKGVSRAVVSFVVVGLALPFLLEYFLPQISTYVHLPPPYEVWIVFIAMGALFAVTSFLQNAYSKGDFHWLLGKIGGGLVGLVFFTYLFLLLPSTVGSAGTQTTGLLLIVYLAIALSYGYLILDFVDVRRTRGAKPQTVDAP